MSSTLRAVADGRWFPVARSEEVIARHIVHTQVLGVELAVWRDDAGAVNAWENRCPHRGVRLSIGRNDGTGLQCQYHGWRFASQNGRCTVIPAHPTQKPASTIHATTYAVREGDGFVWASLGTPTQAPPAFPDGATTLRSIVVEASYDVTAQGLLQGYRFSVDPTAPNAIVYDAKVVALDPFVLRTRSVGERGTTVTFLLQPQTKSQTVVHAGIFDSASASVATDRIGVLRHHNTRMNALRELLERPL